MVGVLTLFRPLRRRWWNSASWLSPMAWTRRRPCLDRSHGPSRHRTRSRHPHRLRCSPCSGSPWNERRRRRPKKRRPGLILGLLLLSLALPLWRWFLAVAGLAPTTDRGPGSDAGMRRYRRFHRTRSRGQAQWLCRIGNRQTAPADRPRPDLRPCRNEGQYRSLSLAVLRGPDDRQTVLRSQRPERPEPLHGRDRSEQRLEGWRSPWF